MLESNPNLMHPRVPGAGQQWNRQNVIPGVAEVAPRIFQCGKCGHVELLPETQPMPGTRF
jgi:hypothetical protein